MSKVSGSHVSVAQKPTPTNLDHDKQYRRLMEQVPANLKLRVIPGETPLFTTSAIGLYDLYLANIPEDIRQTYNCRCCRRFMDQFGGLVTIDPTDGLMTPVMWNIHNVPKLFYPAVWAVFKAIANSKVTGVFLSTEEVWGQPETKYRGPDSVVTWHHLHAIPNPNSLFESKLKTPEQHMAYLLEEFDMLKRGLAEFGPKVVDQAVGILRSGLLDRSTKFMSPAVWLQNLHNERGRLKYTTAKDNVTWLAVATAPAGFCHVRSTMIGELLSDIAEGKNLDTIAKDFAKKVNPTTYQIAQAPPTEGNKKQAEDVVKKLGIQASLRRRFARLQDITEFVWKPISRRPVTRRTVQSSTTGVFSHLKTKDMSPTVRNHVPESTVTWNKFMSTVLPESISVEFMVFSSPSDWFSALVTAAVKSAPPILLWDHQNTRNPVSWYVPEQPQDARTWGLKPGEWAKVTAIVNQPNMWNGGSNYKSDAVFFLLDGAKDNNPNDLAIFPETLKGELHGIRSTITAFSQNGHLEGHDKATACGVRLQGDLHWRGVKVRITRQDSTQAIYNLDRWD